jgi:hypothetical protein
MQAPVTTAAKTAIDKQFLHSTSLRIREKKAQAAVTLFLDTRSNRLMSIEYGQLLETDSSDMDKLLNEVVAKQKAAHAATPALGYTVLPKPEAPHIRAFVQKPYIEFTLAGKTKNGITIDAVVDAIKQAVTSRFYTIPVGANPKIDAAGLSGIKLHVASYLRINDKCTLFLTREHYNFEEALRRGCDAKMRVDNVGKLAKRNRREDAPARLTYRSASVPNSDVLGYWGTSYGDVPMLTREIDIFAASTYDGRSVAIPEGATFRTRIGVLLHDGSFASNMIRLGSFDGHAVADVNRFNAALDTLGIGADVHPHVQELDGDKLTASAPKDLQGHKKGLVGFSHLADLFILFTDSKPEVFRTDDEVWMSFDPLSPGKRLNFDKQFAINSQIADAIDPVSGLGALEAEATYYLDRFQQALLARDNQGIAELIGAVVEDIDADDLIELKSQFGLLDFAKIFAALKMTDEFGEPIGIYDFPRLVQKLIRHMRSQWVKLDKLRIPVRPELGASGYVCPDYSILRHDDPAKDGRGFWFDEGVLDNYQFSLAVNNSAENEFAAELLAIAGLANTDTRYLATGNATIYRQPSGSMVELAAFMLAVRHAFYERNLRSPFLFLSTKLIEITPDFRLWLELVLTASKLKALLEAFDRPGQPQVLPCSAIVLAVMGWGDYDDRGCVVFGYLNDHIQKVHKGLVNTYPNADIEKSKATTVNPFAAAAKADTSNPRILAARATQALISTIDDNYRNNMIGRLAKAQFVYNTLLALGVTINTPLGAALRRTDDTIDARIGKGDIDITKVEQLLKDFWAEVAALGQVPAFVAGDVRFDLRDKLSFYETTTEKQLTAIGVKLDALIGHITSYFMLHENKADRYISFLRNAETNSYQTMMSLRKAFTDMLKVSAAEALRQHRDYIAVASDKQAVSDKIEELARRKACLAFDRVLADHIGDDGTLVAGRFTPAQLEDIAIELYKEIYGPVASKRKAGQMLSDGQLFLPNMGEAFRRAVIRLYAGSHAPVAPVPPAPPTSPSPEGEEEETVATPHVHNTRQFACVKQIKDADQRKAWLATAEAGVPVGVFVLDANNDESMLRAWELIPAWEAKGHRETCIVVVLEDGSHYGWVAANNIERFLGFAGDRRVFNGVLFPRQENKCVGLEVEF